MSYQADIKLIQSFNPEDYSEIEKVFKAFDKNKNGLMEREEFLDLLHALGYRELKQEDADALMEGVDIKDPSKMTFSEFLNVMKKITNKEGKIHLDSFINKAGKAMVKVSKGDNGMQFQTFSEEERTAYVKVINSSLADDPVCKKYLPIDPDSNEVFDRIKDGIDFGFAVEPSSYTQNHFDKTRRILYIFNEIYEVGLSNKKLWEKIMTKKISHSQITADSAEPKSIAELNSLGQMTILGAKKGPDSVEYGMKWLQKLDKIVIDNVRCPNTAKEFISYEYERDREGNFISKYPDKNNHSIDATRYSREQDMKSNTINFGFNTII